MFENKENQRVPEVEFKVIEKGNWKKVSSSSLFAGKKVIVFSLPGAFTPTCSSTHVPRFNELASTFKKEGIDDIICLSVNDTFVMNAWKKDQEAENLTLLPDGNGEFTEKMGLLVSKDDLGFGKRSWRYSMLVDDGVIKKMFIEPEVEGDPFEVSDADTMLEYINPKAERPKSFTLFTKKDCPFCHKAKKLLKEKDLTFEEIQIGREVSMKGMENVTGRSTVPQIFVGGEHIGGSEDLEKYLA
jgi:glutaredoxin-like protein